MDKPSVALRVQRLREDRGLKQSELAAKAGISQSTLSRLENTEIRSGGVQIVLKVARALGVTFSELVVGTPMEGLIHDESKSGDSFFAFCPNPFCDLNEPSLNQDGSVRVDWDSSQQFSSSEYEEINYCESCGTELVKECKGCGKRLHRSVSNYCRRCGDPLNRRPTKDEKLLLSKALAKSKSRYESYGEPVSADDIPF